MVVAESQIDGVVVKEDVPDYTRVITRFGHAPFPPSRLHISVKHLFIWAGCI